MSKTTVGLFTSSSVADQVVRALRAASFAEKEIRLIREPLGMPLADAASTPAIHFRVSVEKDLVAMGATVAEANAYGRGLGRGGVIVCASGPDTLADAAIAIMNRHGAVDVEEFAGTEPISIGMTAGSIPPTTGDSSQVGRIRQSDGGGARVFVW